MAIKFLEQNYVTLLWSGILPKKTEILIFCSIFDYIKNKQKSLKININKKFEKTKYNIATFIILKCKVKKYIFIIYIFVTILYLWKIKRFNKIELIEKIKLKDLIKQYIIIYKSYVINSNNKIIRIRKNLKKNIIFDIIK